MEFGSIDYSALATGRTKALFAEDVALRDTEIRSALRGSRVLVVGGAGSIGSATVRQIAGYRPSALHVVDTSENNLVELVRELRGAVERVPKHTGPFEKP